MPAGTGAIRGRVVDPQTGMPVARARVRLNWMGPGIPRQPVTTDDTGAFTFTGLPAGGFMLNVDKSTYLSTRYPEAGQTLRTSSKPLTLVDGQVIDAITVPLYHGSAITGRVVDAHGDPVEFAQIQAMRLPKTGRGRPQMRSGASTNDLGEFRLPRLEPGKYIVFVMPRRDNMMMYGPPGMPGVPAQSEVVEPQPVPTFYPGVLAIDQALPIAVERGTSVTGVEIALVEGVLAKVSGTLVDASGQPVTRNGSIGVRPIIKDVPGGFGMNGTGVRPDGTFELRLAPGEYELEARATPPGVNGPPPPNSEQMGSVRLTLSGDVNVTIPVGPGATITGRIIFEGEAAVPSVPANQNGPGRIVFSSSDGPGCRSGRSDVAADWTFTIEGVFGTCMARFNGGLAGWNVKRITHNGKDLMDQSVTFTNGQRMRDVEVVMTDKRTELTLHVTDEHGAATREYATVMFSTDKARWVEGSRYLRTYMPPSEQMQGMFSSGGQFGGSGMSFTTVVNGAVVSGGMVGGVVSGGGTSARQAFGAAAAAVASGGSDVRKEMISGMPAGDYYIVALDDVDLESTRDPETLQQLAHAATRVSVIEGAPADVTLRRVKLHDVAQDR